MKIKEQEKSFPVIFGTWSVREVYFSLLRLTLGNMKPMKSDYSFSSFKNVYTFLNCSLIESFPYKNTEYSETNIYTCMCVCLSIYTYVIYTCFYIYTHIYIHIYIHIYTCVYIYIVLRSQIYIYLIS